MKRPFAALAFSVIVIAIAASQAYGHYLWVTINSQTGDHGTTNIYFEGGPSAGDGQYLDPFIDRGTTWIRTIGQSEPQVLQVKDTKEGAKRWLTSELPEGAPRSIDSYGMWGVYRYGETDVLLHYYARNLDVSDHDDLHELARAEQQALDIVPHDEEGEVQLQVVWQGKPATDRSISVRGPSGFKANLKTDKSGRAQFTPKGKGRYTFRTNVYEKGKSGSQDGKEYQEVRHHATLVMKLPVGG